MSQHVWVSFTMTYVTAGLGFFNNDICHSMFGFLLQ